MKRQSGLIRQRVQYRELLLAKRAELLAEIRSELARPGEQGRLAEDDQAPALLEEFISLELQQRVYRTLNEIDAALDRLATGDYGVCADCGEAITPRRLAAIPWAAYCIRCQEHIGQDVEKLDEKAA
jgi:DnaK suppressor protein